MCYLYHSTSKKLKPKLKRSILNSGSGINYKYAGMLAHSFDRFYVVRKVILPSIGDLNFFSTLSYDNTCAYLDNKNMHDTESKKHMLDLMKFCKKIEPFVLYYKRLIKYYNTAHNILENEINLTLPHIPRKQKCGIIATLVSSFIGLAYEGISDFLHHQ